MREEEPEGLWLEPRCVFGLGGGSPDEERPRSKGEGSAGSRRPTRRHSWKSE